MSTRTGCKTFIGTIAFIKQDKRKSFSFVEVGTPIRAMAGEFQPSHLSYGLA